MDEQTIARGMQALSLLDEDIAAAFKELGPPSPRSRPAGFETFLSTIVGQQLSTKVAAIIMQRLINLMGSVTPARLIEIEDQALRDVGLSWRKVEYVKRLANAIITNSLDIESLSDLSDEEAIIEIMQLKGFGRWSAEIYLIFSLNRQDIFPADDLGILLGLAKLKGLTEKPTPKQARQMVEHWQGWRSVGSLFLWQYYHQPK
ncbi:DNA-3-methyladenine glycosylase 2 family protein [Psychromonas sp. 14N.309.X.WAT.B.A12]|uniref:DNA-3-methyladenine glycosylase family protein n=1 Tax=Psychromonas sp. 14N.309.X.WAT.B.A12 TaxID=2998322 RepID=UPI0025B0A5F6|nr:DNA-3-methyladenine glycosylase 2 family protein [Psychromonas sp. 14N.309.X.WAT.B.A12]MDN2661761.1 DNA-3-methyladenine glycosylase 2 family protein [Psychromonas sp. 14N.309.X.WAT.B.A12]